MYWTPEEVSLMKEAFKENLATKKLPSFAYCIQVISEHPELQHRDKKTVKAWVYNEMKRSEKL